MEIVIFVLIDILQYYSVRRDASFQYNNVMYGIVLEGWIS